VVHADQDGVCASKNTIIATSPEVIPNFMLFRLANSAADNLHFTAEADIEF
jgi:alpha-L-fucosidase 2